METHQFCSDDILVEILTFLPAKSLMHSSVFLKLVILRPNIPTSFNPTMLVLKPAPQPPDFYFNSEHILL
ncbi:hypothetical protein H5410_024576 [Solanum commersonii]|uniref:F-box domain-containing protein n=1 Tax=Solanum commersonii TaxID=4109 RepID=A0A9J5ZMF1_SOLCO|nr:hypothetical protein H5410_024576 [Solanum commersonii]